MGGLNMPRFNALTKEQKQDIVTRTFHTQF